MRHQAGPGGRPRCEAVARAAAPGGTQDASLPVATHRTAPVQAAAGAAVRETAAAENSGNGVTAGGGIAGIAEAAGVPRPGDRGGGAVEVTGSPGVASRGALAARGGRVPERARERGRRSPRPGRAVTRDAIPGLPVTSTAAPGGAPERPLRDRDIGA